MLTDGLSPFEMIQWISLKMILKVCWMYSDFMSICTVVLDVFLSAKTVNNHYTKDQISYTNMRANDKDVRIQIDPTPLAELSPRSCTRTT